VASLVWGICSLHADPNGLRNVVRHGPPRYHFIHSPPAALKSGKNDLPTRAIRCDRSAAGRTLTGPAVSLKQDCSGFSDAPHVALGHDIAKRRAQ
jgi:hypothetical protein